MTITLRPYQQEFKSDIYQSWQQGNRNVLGVLSTGGGKTQIFSDIILDGVKQGLQQAIVVHRNELVSQIAVTLATRGIPHRIVGSDKSISMAVRKQRDKVGRSFYNPSSQTAVIGVDTLIARDGSLKDWAAQTDRWVQDEAHHLLRKNKWGKAVNMMPNAYGLGVTATPSRADGCGLGADYEGYFHSMVVGPPMRWLVEQGYLADYEIACPTSDLEVEDDKRGSNGDWSAQYLKKAAKESKIVGDVVQNYIRLAAGRKAICFATDVETSNEIAKKFNDFGIRAESLNAKTPAAFREAALKDFELGNIMVLVNVDLFDEGFDVGDCEVCIMSRPTASLAKYLQQIGRVLRPHPGKVALIIDHVSNVLRHNLPDIYRQWVLARRDKRSKSAPDPEDIPLTRCLMEMCLKPYPRFLPQCPYCGTMKPLPEPSQRSVQMVDGDLVLLDRATLERMRAATRLDSAADLAERVGYASGNPIAAKAAANRQIEKIEEHGKLRNAMAQWAAIQRSKGHSDREIQKKFYLTVGYDVLSALDASKTHAEMQEIREMIEGWYAR